MWARECVCGVRSGCRVVGGEEVVGLVVQRG